ncbi:Protein downstream neighbor of son [Nymphon striatum]|nr:Protein downstream neighbor of son [Nymphon striatum]
MDHHRSPGTPWKKPSDVMKKFRKSKKRSSSNDDENSFSEITPNVKKKLSTSVSESFNPFRCQKTDKKNNASQIHSSTNVNKDPSIFSAFLNVEKEHRNPVTAKPLPSNSVTSCDDDNASDAIYQENEETWNKCLPIDWSLKSKARFISKKPFSWTGNLKTSEEASGITGFVRCLASASNSEQTNDLHCLALGLVDTHGKTQTNWKLKPLEMKIAAGISGINEIHALLTPSTRGLRGVLRQEDCDGESSMQSMEPDANQTDEENEEDEDDEAVSWLETMGLETTTFPELNPNKIKIMKEKSKDVDHRPESLLYVEGVEVQGLFNFLLNNKNSIPSTGPLAGVPPTLLAPIAFQGATLTPLQARQAYLKQDKNKYHAIQLSGPLMPHIMYSLCDLFKNSQDGQFSAIFGTLDQTAPFTLFNSKQPNSPAPPIFAQENLTDCGLPSNLLSAFCASPSTSSIIQNLKKKIKEYAMVSKP